MQEYWMSRKTKEEYIYYQIREYMIQNHPDIIYHIDFTALNISKGLYQNYNYINPCKWPKFFLAKPNKRFKGLFLEILPESSKVLKANGRAITTRGSASRTEATIEKLNNMGYKSLFIKGFKAAIQEIENYLNY